MYYEKRYGHQRTTQKPIIGTKKPLHRAASLEKQKHNGTKYLDFINKLCSANYYIQHYYY